MRLDDTAGLPAVLTTAAAAELLDCSEDLLWRLARAGEAPVEPLRLGRVLRWPTARLLDLLGVADQPVADRPMDPRRDSPRAEQSAGPTLVTGRAREETNDIVRTDREGPRALETG